jgi:hypothetical protein
MEIQKYSVLKRVKKLKLPVKKRFKADVIFNSFDLTRTPPVEIVAAASTKELIPLKKPKRESESKKRLRLHYEEIKLAWPSDKVRTFKKKDKRAHRHLFKDDAEYSIFCTWVNECRREVRPKVKKHRRHKSKKQRKPRRTSYEKFIASDLWQNRKNKYYQSHERRCAACNSYKYIQLHHMVYGEFGNEPDEHLIPLCDTHHKGYHELHGTQRHMLRTTLEYIDAIRSTVSTTPEPSI